MTGQQMQLEIIEINDLLDYFMEMNIIQLNDHMVDVKTQQYYPLNII